MPVLRIAHLSDLHFNPKKDSEVWVQVAGFINKEVQPHLVLVTGDVSDNATRKELEFAAAQLRLLTPHVDGDPLGYRIVPGNHDRFPALGNTFGFAGGLGYSLDKSYRFSARFTDNIVSARKPYDIDIPAGNTTWKLRIIGLDSNDAKQYFAQGYVSQTSIADAATAARNSSDRDLVIALVHHHVLPIPGLEEMRGGQGTGLKLLPNVTGLLNSGSLLSHLSSARVDLILHGHEHMRNHARFGSLEDGASNMVVLAAGSGTGAATGGNFQLNRVHFNILELREDPSMWLQEVGIKNGALGYISEWRQLLTPQDIRQSRFVRRNRLKPGAATATAKRFPKSRIKKLVRFSEMRDIEITETRTHWAVDSAFTQVTRNSSGQLSDLLVECQWLGGPLMEYRGSFLPKHGELDRYVGEVKLNGSGEAERITSTWIWYGGGALTHSDLQTLQNSQADPIRKEGREYAAIRASAELESLSITVQLPFRYVPRLEDVKVLVESPERPGILMPSTELEKTLDFCGRSIFELRVPFPLPGYTYYVTWPVCKDFSPRPAEASTFAAVAKAHVESITSAVSERLLRQLLPQKLRIDLYVPQDGTDAVLERISAADAGSPTLLSRRAARGMARLAWWGASPLIEREDISEIADDADREFCEDERILVMAPVRGLEQPGTAALGILRVGVRGPLAMAVQKGHPPMDRMGLTALVVEAASIVLTVARQSY